MSRGQRPEWLYGLDLKPGQVNGGPAYLFDWQKLGADSTGLRFVVINTGGGVLTVTPEAGYDGVHTEVGAQAPQSFDVQPGTAYGDPYGADEMRPWWRLSLSGVSSFMWGVLGLPRLKP